MTTAKQRQYQKQYKNRFKNFTCKKKRRKTKKLTTFKAQKYVLNKL
jgi:hypothetical protein